MIAIETRQLAGGVVLHAFPEGKRAVPLPCVVFYHGFTSSSLVYSYFAVALAQAGFRVVMPDAPEHGARFGGDSQGRIHRFWQILHQNMQEFTTLRAAIQAENWLLDGRLAVGGASMGGMTALGIMTRHREVKCGASLMGSGYFTGLARTLFPPLSPQNPAQQAEFDNIIAPLNSIPARSPILLLSTSATSFPTTLSIFCSAMAVSISVLYRPSAVKPFPLVNIQWPA